MKKAILIFSLMLTAFVASAQKNFSGDFTKVKETQKSIAYEFNFKETKISNHKSMTIAEATMRNHRDWTQRLERQKEWFVGSVNHDTGGMLDIANVDDFDVKLIVKVLSIKDDIEMPVIDAIFVDAEGNELCRLSGISDEDFNDVGHKLGSQLKKLCKK